MLVLRALVLVLRALMLHVKTVKCLCVKCLVRMSNKSVITCVSDTYVYNAKEYPPVSH